jgi:AAA+ ATPase superfamily predicted ATPase
VATYAVWGGVPAYWERIDDTTSVLDNIRVQLLPSNAMMQEEPRILLQDFINDPHNYVGILRAIASGSHSQSEICNFTGLSRGMVSKYLSVLRETGFVERQVPVNENQSDSRRGRYFITDPYLRFYYRFLAAYQAKLAMGEQRQMLDTIEKEMPDFIQTYTWQELCQEWTLRASAREALPLNIEKVGSVWTRTQDIAVVGINSIAKHLVLGSCRWDTVPADDEDIRELVAKVPLIIPKDEPWSLYFVGFSSGGWTEDVRQNRDRIIQRELADSWRYEGSRLVDLESISEDLNAWSVVLN